MDSSNETEVVDLHLTKATPDHENYTVQKTKKTIQAFTSFSKIITEKDI